MGLNGMLMTDKNRKMEAMTSPNPRQQAFHRGSSFYSKVILENSKKDLQKSILRIEMAIEFWGIVEDRKCLN